jgi:DNA-directed RNA polymerase sigma subunit (sigma70/sigma32)
MAGALDMIGEEWPSEDGWPYPDADVETDALDVDAEMDDDLVSLHALAPHLFDGLSGLERDVVTARFGLDGRPARSMKELQQTMQVPRADLRIALGDGLAKLRVQLGPR